MQDIEPALDARQYGNRINHGQHRIISFSWSNVFTKRSKMDAAQRSLAIDYSKAFDRVDVTVALEKLLGMCAVSCCPGWVTS